MRREFVIISDLPVRGVPDGCGLELGPTTPSASSTSTPLPSTPSLEVAIPSAHELLNLKKGWLMKQGLTKVNLIQMKLYKIV